MSILSKFHYQVIGKKSGHKMVFLHGVMGFGANWKTLANNFANDFEILLFDQRGHGRSFQPESGYAPEDYAKDLKLIIDELKWEKITLIGHSMGGRNAATFTDMFPQYVNALVIVDIGPISDQASMDAIQEKINFVPTPFKSREAARQFFDEDFIKKYPEPLVKQFFYANLYEKKRDEFDWRFNKDAILSTLKASRAANLWPIFESITVPTLLIRGEKSKDLPQALFREVLAKNSKIKGVQIEGAGHWVHVDSPAATLNAINEFLRANDIVS